MGIKNPTNPDAVFTSLNVESGLKNLTPNNIIVKALGFIEFECNTVIILKAEKP
jgi:hypothetical protein